MLVYQKDPESRGYICDHSYTYIVYLACLLPASFSLGALLIVVGLFAKFHFCGTWSVRPLRKIS